MTWEGERRSGGGGKNVSRGWERLTGIEVEEERNDARGEVSTLWVIWGRSEGRMSRKSGMRHHHVENEASWSGFVSYVPHMPSRRKKNTAKPAWTE
ncbi:hypothetical protein RRG08_060278 [Elysia crispata]|uniref:Uncharacterized protein n=1 Tax=Elysia crispata TaxID=231223 RepID=A0AAE1ADT2_9GAST|nr:hypothetical protein RRG08_060278 [Elysia crispata]